MSLTFLIAVTGMVCCFAASLAQTAQPALANIPDATLHDGSLQATPYRFSLLLMRDHPELLDEAIDPVARAVLTAETKVRKEQNTLTQKPSFAVEWQTLEKTQYAKNALAAYLRPDDPWIFLNSIPAWKSLAHPAWVGMYLFPSDEELNRDPAFTAHEVAPQMKQQLQLAAAAESADLWYVTELNARDCPYDMAAHVLRCATDLLQPESSYGATPGKPASDATNATYMLRIVTSPFEPETQFPVGGLRQHFSELEAWRDAVGKQARVNLMVFDRQLRPEAIPIDPKVAEIHHLNDPKTVLHVHIFFTMMHSEPNGTSKTDFVVFAKLRKVEFVAADGTKLGEIAAAALPEPGAVAAVAPSHFFNASFTEAIAETEKQNERNSEATAAERKVKTEEKQADLKVRHAKEEDCRRESIAKANAQVGTSTGTPTREWLQAKEVVRKGFYETCLKDGPSPTPPVQQVEQVTPKPPFVAPARTPAALAPRSTTPAPVASRGSTPIPPPEQSQTPVAIPHSYALIFASNDYQSWPHLQNPIPDAEALSQTLRNNYSFQTEVIKNPTAEDILKTLRGYVERKFEPQDQLLIFFSSHGYFDDARGQGFIVPVDAPTLAADPEHLHMVPHDTILHLVSRIPSQHIVLMMDACFAGTLDRRVADVGTRGPGGHLIDPERGTPLAEQLHRAMDRRTRRYFTSGGKEYVPDGAPGHHSPFVAALLRKLNEPKDYLRLADLQQGLETVDPEPLYGEIDGDNAPRSDFFFLSPAAMKDLTAK